MLITEFKYITIHNSLALIY